WQWPARILSRVQQRRGRRCRGVCTRGGIGAARAACRFQALGSLPRDPTMTTTMTQLIADLATGRVEVVDLTIPLGSETQVIGLPPMFASSPGVSIDVISRYDDRGPAWYWNTITMGEHTGTHFDAPVHWITGRDLGENACDTIPAARFVGPACVIDITKEVEANPDYLLTPQDLERWERQNGRVPRNAWVL